MGKRSMLRIPLHARGGCGSFRFEDAGDAATGHAVVFTKAVSPRFSLRREVEGSYVLPAQVGPDRGDDGHDAAGDGE
jgi:hypothetical protein